MTVYPKRTRTGEKTPINARWSGACPDPPHPDHRWELSVGPDSDGDPYVEVFARTLNDDDSGLAALTPTQARQVAASILAAADWVEANR